MDPNACLKEVLSLANSMMEDYSSERSNGIDQDDAASLAEHIINLHEWIKKGGFLPKEWRNDGMPKM